MKDIPEKKNLTIRIIIVISIMTIIAAIHAFRIGTYFEGKLYTYYYSYASDLMLPFGAYFLLSLNEIQFRFLQPWYTKVLIVFGVMTLSEILQYFEIYFFGVTFDFIDIVMFGLGALIAAFFEKQVLFRFVPQWKY